MVTKRHIAMDLAFYEHSRCAIFDGMCGERDNVFPFSEMLSLADYLAISDDFVSHDPVAGHCCTSRTHSSSASRSARSIFVLRASCLLYYKRVTCRLSGSITLRSTCGYSHHPLPRHVLYAYVASRHASRLLYAPHTFSIRMRTFDASLLWIDLI